MLWQVDVKRATPKADGMGGMRGGRGGRGGRGRGRGGECNLYISYGWSLFIGRLQWKISNKGSPNSNSKCPFLTLILYTNSNAILCSMRMLVSNSNHIITTGLNLIPPSVSYVKLSPRLTINKIWPSLQTLDEHTLLL